MNTTTWTHPTTGETRHYLDNNEVEGIALQVGRDTDNRLSNADLGRIQAAKFWLDDAGALHIDKLSDRGKIYFIAAALRTAIENKIADGVWIVTSTRNPSEYEDMTTAQDDYEDEWEAHDRAEIDAQRAEVEEERRAELATEQAESMAARQTAAEECATRIACEKTRDGWKLSTPAALTDAEAMALTFLAEPQQVIMGAYVEVIDAGGIRTGELTTATYHRRTWGPAYVICSITLS